MVVVVSLVCRENDVEDGCVLEFENCLSNIGLTLLPALLFVVAKPKTFAPGMVLVRFVGGLMAVVAVVVAGVVASLLCGRSDCI